MVRAYDFELARVSIIVSIQVTIPLGRNQHDEGCLNHVCHLLKTSARERLKMEGFHWLAPALEGLEE